MFSAESSSALKGAGQQHETMGTVGSTKPWVLSEARNTVLDTMPFCFRRDGIGGLAIGNNFLA